MEGGPGWGYKRKGRRPANRHDQWEAASALLARLSSKVTFAIGQMARGRSGVTVRAGVTSRGPGRTLIRRSSAVIFKESVARRRFRGPA